MNIYIVEDDPWYAEILKFHLMLNPENSVEVFEKGEECLKSLYRKPDIICIDYGLPDMTGDRLLAKIKAYDNQLPVIVLSAQEEVSVAIDLLKSGAEDYIIKSDNAKELLWNSIHKLQRRAELEKEVVHLKEELNKKYDFGKNIWGQSSAIKKVFSLVEKACKTNINVSVTGETGTGKELVAKAIHYNSRQAKKSFIAVNMSAIPSELLESELFGYEKGAFTGAVSRKKGKLEEANGGTLFLDEIADMDMSLQAKLLRVLQERELVRLGGNEIIKLDFRLITATHKNLRQLAEDGVFREDLFYRISGLPIELPPLRDRENDIILLSARFIKEFVKANKLPDITLGESAREALLAYSFPGNVRELKSIVELACVLTNDSVIESEHISFNSPGKQFISVEKSLKEHTKDIIEAYLKKYGNVVEVARKLQIGKSTIYNLIKSNTLNTK